MHSFEGELPITKAFVDALLNHTKSPKLFLLGEEGHTEIQDRMPFVPELKIDVDATATAPRESQQIAQPWIRDFKPQILDLQKIFASYSNLEKLSVSVNILRGGCVIDLSTPSTRIIPLSDGVTFPPLKHLSLSGFSISDEELSLWKDRFPWDKLESLSLGVQETPRVLETALGNVQDLKEFQITSYTRYNVSRSTPALEAFLSSFHSLESLTAKGLVPTLETVMQHPKLKHLCLHAIEETDAERQILSIKEIEDLSQYCLHLTSLELDMNPNGAWVSWEIFTLAILAC